MVPRQAITLHKAAHEHRPDSSTDGTKRPSSHIPKLNLDRATQHAKNTGSRRALDAQSLTRLHSLNPKGSSKNLVIPKVVRAIRDIDTKAPHTGRLRRHSGTQCGNESARSHSSEKRLITIRKRLVPQDLITDAKAVHVGHNPI